MLYIMYDKVIDGWEAMVDINAVYTSNNTFRWPISVLKKKKQPLGPAASDISGQM